MERNTVTTFFNLVTGDRFYKANDKKKTVHEKTGPKFSIDAAINDSITVNEFIKSQCLKAVKGDTQVIFLRHNEP